MATEYAKALGERLRAVRRQRGLSLEAVHKRSGGRWKAVVVGSYERGDRSVTAQRLAELAKFYGVSVASLLPDLGSVSPRRDDPGLVLDGAALAALADPIADPLRRYVSTLLDRRGTPGDGSIALRARDVSALAAVYGVPPGQLTALLHRWLVTG